MTRIAFVTTMAGFPWGGSEVVWARVAEMAAGEGDRVLAAVFDWSESVPAVQRLAQHGVQILTRPREVRRNLVQRAIGRVVKPKTPQWLESLRAFAPEVVCVSSGIHWEVLDEPQLFEWLIGERVPYVLVVQCNSERLWMNDTRRDAERRILDAAITVVFVSEGNRELAERHLATRFPNSVMISNTVERAYDEPLPWPPGDPVFASVARFDVAYKGHDILFKVLGEPQWRERRWSCRLFGDGPDARYVRELIALYGLQSRVELAGHVSDVRAIWAGSHVCVLPSRAEGTPLAMLEAFVAGRPAVVTDVGGNAEWTDEGETGFIAEAATPRSFGAAMERAWNARERWEAMGREAFARTRARLEPRTGEALLRVIRQR